MLEQKSQKYVKNLKCPRFGRFFCFEIFLRFFVQALSTIFFVHCSFLGTPPSHGSSLAIPLLHGLSLTIPLFHSSGLAIPPSHGPGDG